MIVGFDPGTVSALAALDLNGSLVFTKEFRGGVKQAVRIMSKKEPAAIVASDKAFMESVKDLAVSLGAKAFFPSNDLSQREKNRLVRKYNIKSPHKKDALAAALHAYRQHRELIGKVRSRENEIFRLLLRGDKPNLSRALEPAGRRKTQTRPRRKIEIERRVDDLERRLRMTEEILAEKEEELKKNGSRGPPRRQIIIKDEYRAERRARARLDRELEEAHSRLARIEAELDRLKTSPPAKKEDIRKKVLRMIRRYKERFRK